MTIRVAWLTVLLASVVATGCASSGTVPRPLPFPGATAPPASPDDSRPDPTDATPPAAVLATALALRGTPYVNGGSDPSRGFDCSGFVQWVFAQHGASLPRETKEQYGEGERVDPDEIQPGDLVFFQTVSRGASHVGIALENGEFVHAPSSRGVVRVERYTSGYWSSRWVGARRVTASSAQ
jgi:cell wall-associated NlpC family hydrolase